jgi:hypothetical protein
VKLLNVLFVITFETEELQAAGFLHLSPAPFSLKVGEVYGRVRGAF